MLRQRSHETLPAEQTDHGVSSEVELQVETLETSEVIEVETADEAAVPKTGDIEQPVQPQHSIVADRQRRQIKPPVRYAYIDFAYALTVGDEVEIDEPSSYSEAMASNESSQWLGVMSEEMESLHRNQT